MAQTISSLSKKKILNILSHWVLNLSSNHIYYHIQKDWTTHKLILEMKGLHNIPGI